MRARQSLSCTSEAASRTDRFGKATTTSSKSSCSRPTAPASRAGSRSSTTRTARAATGWLSTFDRGATFTRSRSTTTRRPACGAWTRPTPTAGICASRRPSARSASRATPITRLVGPGPTTCSSTPSPPESAASAATGPERNTRRRCSRRTSSTLPGCLPPGSSTSARSATNRATRPCGPAAASSAIDPARLSVTTG